MVWTWIGDNPGEVAVVVLYSIGLLGMWIGSRRKKSAQRRQLIRRVKGEV